VGRGEVRRVIPHSSVSQRAARRCVATVFTIDDRIRPGSLRHEQPVHGFPRSSRASAKSAWAISSSYCPFDFARDFPRARLTACYPKSEAARSSKVHKDNRMATFVSECARDLSVLTTFSLHNVSVGSARPPVIAARPTFCHHRILEFALRNALGRSESGHR